MTELWRWADEASERFAQQAPQYDRFRPRYPSELFDSLIAEAHVRPGDQVVEIGAGTGIATVPLDERGLIVCAVEPSDVLAGVARSKLAGQSRLFVGRFEDLPLPGPVRLVASFNSWHWVQPQTGVERVAQLLAPGDHLGLVWTEVLSWGEPPFEQRVADIFGATWPKEMPHISESMEPISSDARFSEFRELHFPFERRLDGASYVAVTQTYGGQRSLEQYEALEDAIASEFGGGVTKREDAVLYLSQRL